MKCMLRWPAAGIPHVRVTSNQLPGSHQTIFPPGVVVAGAAQRPPIARVPALVEQLALFGQAAAVGAAQRIGVQRFEHAVPLALPQLLRPCPAAMAAAVAVAGGAVVTVHWATSVVAGWQAHHAAVDTALIIVLPLRCVSRTLLLVGWHGASRGVWRRCRCPRRAAAAGAGPLTSRAPPLSHLVARRKRPKGGEARWRNEVSGSAAELRRAHQERTVRRN